MHNSWLILVKLFLIFILYKRCYTSHTSLGQVYATLSRIIHKETNPIWLSRHVSRKSNSQYMLATETNIFSVGTSYAKLFSVTLFLEE